MMSPMKLPGCARRPPPGSGNDCGPDGPDRSPEEARLNQKRLAQNTRPPNQEQGGAEPRCSGCGIPLISYQRDEHLVCMTCRAWHRHRRHILAAVAAMKGAR